MVLPLNVYRRSLVRPNNPQSLRPTYCAIRKDPAVHVSLSSYSVVKQPGTEAPLPAGSHQTHHPTTNDTRQPSAVFSLISVRSLEARKHTLTRGLRQRRAQWAVYRPGLRLLSTTIVNKISHRSAHCSPGVDCRKDRGFYGLSPHLSHNVATF